VLVVTIPSRENMPELVSKKLKASPERNSGI